LEVFDLRMVRVESAAEGKVMVAGINIFGN